MEGLRDWGQVEYDLAKAQNSWVDSQEEKLVYVCKK